MEMFLTRLGEGARVVVTGDTRQTDVLDGPSGLVQAIDLIEKFQIPAEVIKFTKQDVVRSELCRAWVEAFEQA